jgi:hypothetical protein
VTRLEIGVENLISGFEYLTVAELIFNTTYAKYWIYVA